MGPPAPAASPGRAAPPWPQMTSQQLLGLGGAAAASCGEEEHAHAVDSRGPPRAKPTAEAACHQQLVGHLNAAARRRRRRYLVRRRPYRPGAPAAPRWSGHSSTTSWRGTACPSKFTTAPMPQASCSKRSEYRVFMVTSIRFLPLPLALSCLERVPPRRRVWRGPLTIKTGPG